MAMTPDTTAAGVYTDFQGLAQLQRLAGGNEQKALPEAARQFEALLLQMMLKSMREASPGGGIFGSDQEKLYRDLFDKQMGLTLAQHGGIGLADAMVRALKERSASQQVRSGSSGRVEQGASGSPSPAAAAEAVAAAAGPSADPAAFVERIWPEAQRVGRRLGVDPKVLVAQAALETGWGQGVPRLPDGRSTHNMFGIKADKGWSGAAAVVPTVEYRGGTATREQAAFRAYGSVSESFDDYARLLEGHPRYREALAHGADAGRFAQALQAAGYATDPSYAAKVQDVLSRLGLKPGAEGPTV